MFMFETRYPLELTNLAVDMKERRRDHTQGWSGFVKRFPNG
jgi:homogentisate 1,2-dioxygenase